MNIAIAGGGTGGHLFPGIALAEELVDRGHRVLFIGTAQGIEARVCPRDGWPIELITVSGIKGKGLLGALGGVFAVPRAIAQSRSILRQFAADVVVGVGGYASGPVGLAATMMRTPLYLLEQNSVPGITNRTLGRVARGVFGTFAGAASYFPKETYHLVGNPIRKSVRESLARTASHSRDTLLIVGGSQGARGVNRIVGDALIELQKSGAAFPVVHQCGKADFDELKAKYQTAGLGKVELQPFFDNMADVYAKARLVIARAGATTIAELTLLGLPAFLIPFPEAADDHQTKNADEIAAAGAARVLPQATTTPSELAARVRELYFDKAGLAKMANAARGQSHPDAHKLIADAITARSE